MENFILIEDSTLREGEQTPGVSFSFEQKKEILFKLAEAGIEYAEVGIPAMGIETIEEIRRLQRYRKIPKLIGWNRGVREDLDKSFESGLSAVHIGLPSSLIHIKDKFKKDENWVIETAQHLVEYAKKSGADFISVSAEDMGRADIEFLKRYSHFLYKSGASRMRLSDTVGCLSPNKTFNIVSRIKEHTPNLDLQMHMHNDLGLSLANSLYGIKAGATQLHVTINGLGDRAGITSLHQAAVILKILENKVTNIKLDRIYELSNMVADYTGLKVAHNEPVIGANVFSHESGIHIEGLLKEGKSFETFDPSIVSRKHEFVIGKHTGSTAIKYVLEENDVYISRDQAKLITPYVRKKCQNKSEDSVMDVNELICLAQEKLKLNTEKKWIDIHT